MRLSTALLTAVSGAAVFLLSACSNAPQSNGLPPTGVGAGSPRSSGSAYRAAHGLQLPGGRVLYVTVFGNAVEALKYGTWMKVGAITSGINQPFSSWVDTNGNLYVGNTASSNENVTEYGSSGGLIFTYNADMTEPLAVTTDRTGNVYEGDISGNVNEYAQGSDVVSATCTLPGAVEGIAVDRRHDVFADVISPNGGAEIVVFPRGLTVHGFSCANAVLPVTVRGFGGIAIDKQGDLVVCDSAAPAVDILAPPYTKITGTLGSGWSQPTAVSIDKAGTQAYVIDQGTADVQILTYPGGSVVATLGFGNGLVEPLSAVDSKNYVP